MRKGVRKRDLESYRRNPVTFNLQNTNSGERPHAQRKQMEPIDVNGSVHTARKQHQRICVGICVLTSNVDWAQTSTHESVLRFLAETASYAFKAFSPGRTLRRCLDSCTPSGNIVLQFTEFRPMQKKWKSRKNAKTCSVLLGSQGTKRKNV